MSRFAVNPPPSEFLPISAQARRDSLAATLAAAPERGPVWVFGAGSLMWDPGFAPAEMRNGALDAYCRSFSFWTIRARGSPANPGLGLVLEPDDSRVHGVAFRLRDDTREADLDALWRREMFGGVYRPTWCPVETAAGVVPAICFVGDRSHPNYAGRLPECETAAIIAGAYGERGRCRDYLALLVATLDRRGLDDPAMARLLERVDAAAEASP